MIDRNHRRQLDVKTFFDANDDGIGDVGGLTQKRDYIEDPGARLQDKI